VKIGLLLFFIVAAIAIKRPFCRVICPIGAVYSLFNKGSLTHLKLEQSTCITCGLCRKVCPMDIDPQQSQNQLECIRCGECVSACPKSCLKFRA
jgi:polyferredoxin